MKWNKDPYRILGVSRDASTQDIKSAYRQIARRLHPDVNPNNAAAELQFQDVTIAHDILTDSAKRSEYNQRNQANAGYHFTLQMTSSKRTVVPLDEPQVIYLLADIDPDPRAREQVENHQARLNMTLVLDQSNSMSKSNRIERVKIAAHQIIDNMSELDILSVVAFNNRAVTLIEATPVKDKPALKAKISLLKAEYGTEIFKGLEAGAAQVRQYAAPRLVNHIILLTDGHTYGDEAKSLALADQLAKEGIGISAMGLGHDWNDKFLDDLASRTGGSSAYVSTASSVVRFLNDQVRSLANAFADRMILAVATDKDVMLEFAFKLAPNPQPLPVESSIIHLGNLQANKTISVLIQIQLPPKMALGNRSIARITSSGDILINDSQTYEEVADMGIEVTTTITREEPPTAILDALSKLTLYRIQERAQEALDNGNASEATRRLENLATRFFAMGQEDLATKARMEARRIARTQEFSERGRKALKYQTRLFLGGATGEDLSSSPSDDEEDAE